MNKLVAAIMVAGLGATGVQAQNEFTNTWVGANSGTAYWKDAANWDPAVVPNDPGVVVIIPQDHHNIKIDLADFAGADDSGDITVGVLIVYGTGWQDSYPLEMIFSSDGTSLVYDNDGLPARIEWIRVNWDGHLQINAPQVFVDETHFVGGYGINLVGASLSGVGPVVQSCRTLRVYADPGTTNVVSVPIVTAAGVLPEYFFIFGGGGCVLVENCRDDREIILPLGATYGGLIDNGTQLILSDSVFRGDTMYAGAIINRNNNALLVQNGSEFHYNSGVFLGAESATRDNLYVVADPGSKLMLTSVNMDGWDNQLFVKDGGYASFNALSFWNTSFRQFVQLSSALENEPAILDLNGGDIQFFRDEYRDNATDCVISVLPGGIVTNAANIAVGWDGGTAGNRIQLGGGQIFCANLTFGPYNGVEVLNPAVGGEIFPIIASTAAKFSDGAKVYAENLSIPGRYPLVTAPSIDFDGVALDTPDLVELPPLFNGKLIIAPNGDGTETLWLNLFKGGTLLLAR